MSRERKLLILEEGEETEVSENKLEEELAKSGRKCSNAAIAIDRVEHTRERQAPSVEWIH